MAGLSEWDVAEDAASACSAAGLRPELLGRAMGSLSGGETERATLAAILVARFDVLLLDEPTNDLDFEGLGRLERFIHSSPAAMLLVSHDRDFLDRTVTRVLELDEWTHTAREYAGGWAEYETERELARMRQYQRWGHSLEERRLIEEQAARMRAWEERGYGQGRKKKKTKDVKKAYAKKLAQVDVVEKPFEPWELRFSIAPEARSADIVVRLESAVVERGSFRIGPIDLEIGAGERVALAGPNGSGKTTLLRALLGELPLTAGRGHLGPGVVVGELDQLRESFASDEPLVEAFRHAAGVSTGDARTLLAKFGLGADDVLRAGSSLSPGERTRAEVALLAARKVNFLVLDEPTNHLDLTAIDELEAAIARFEGAILLVPHDRRFLDAFGATRTVSLQ